MKDPVRRRFVFVALGLLALACRDDAAVRDFVARFVESAATGTEFYRQHEAVGREMDGEKVRRAITARFEVIGCRNFSLSPLHASDDWECHLQFQNGAAGTLWVHFDEAHPTAWLSGDLEPR